jgi:hypothetical protein
VIVVEDIAQGLEFVAQNVDTFEGFTWHRQGAYRRLPQRSNPRMPPTAAPD